MPAALNNDLACTAGGTGQNANVANSARQQRSGCNATRRDKMQSVPQSFAEDTQTNETCRTDEEKSVEPHRAIRGCQSVKMQISWHANVRRRMRECASSPCGVVAVISQQREKAKQPKYVRPSHRGLAPGVIFDAFREPRRRDAAPLCEW